MSLSSKLIVVVYHSPYGHTAKVAHYIAEGAKQSELNVQLMDVEHIDWDVLDQAEAIVMGCPTYMGSISAAMKLFMEQSSKRWLARSWQGKLAAAFTNGGGLSGDKLAVLQQINLFAMQHGMLWTGLPLMPTGRSNADLNRMSSFLGLMTQSDNAPVDVTPPEGDLRTAVQFGQHIAHTVQRLN
ncbi:flavodoxin [Acinetobacter sp. NCu2D-2]|uniref:flavodoxin family protein n=1 Tax=Acinetobacter sp. NCu2D-2 TaxID=1608473 RepID=UPI0007CDDBD5|nr:flavodoxin family protein [Acinetobacter sp. NCu2D-2]ANF82258.1 flavodoxin [Acinetobacter sp. NCu2D-2]